MTVEQFRQLMLKHFEERYKALNKKGRENEYHSDIGCRNWAKKVFSEAKKLEEYNIAALIQAQTLDDILAACVEVEYDDWSNEIEYIDRSTFAAVVALVVEEHAS